MVVEGNSGTVNLTFTVTMTGPTAGPVSVNYATRQRTAIAGVDFTAGGGLLTLSGTTTATITVPVQGDTIAEIDEDVLVELSGVTGAVLGTALAVGTIVNDDVAPPATAERVTFARLVNATAANGTLTKNDADGWTAGGGSARRALAAGDGSVEFSVPATDQGVAIGLSRGDSSTELSDIDFAIAPFLGQIYVVERGVAPQGSFGIYAAGDRFAVVVSGGVVSYQRNGVTFYTSTFAPHYPLLVDATLYTVGAELTDVVFGGSITQTPRRLGDIDGDAQTDVVIYRPYNGTWYTLHSGSGHTDYSAIANAATDALPVPADYDGDGAADVAVYRPDTGMWEIRQSSTYFTTTLNLLWGAPGDVPMPGDFDGDGKADPTVYRPSDGTSAAMWYVLASSTGYTANFGIAFGTVGDQPVMGDYDGDGLADPVVYRPSTYRWFILRSSYGYHYNGTVVVDWGADDAITVPGDFDGDGKFDPTVYRPSNGRWYSLQSSTGYATYLEQHFGLSGDVPIMGSYDGDNKADIVIYRPSSGSWLVLMSSTNNTYAMSFVWGFGNQYPALRRP
jgi:hypothetical protein